MYPNISGCPMASQSQPDASEEIVDAEMGNGSTRFLKIMFNFCYLKS